MVHARNLPENDDPLNKAALECLPENHADPAYLHLLNLAAWGLEQGVRGDWPDRDHHAVETQLSLLFGWKPANVLPWLLSNPDGPEDPEEQEQNLLVAMNRAEDSESAARWVLNCIYDRLKAEVPALQPAASELSEASNERRAHETYIDNGQVDEIPELKDCRACSTHKAVLQFAEKAYEGLARKVVYGLQQIDSTGIYGGDYRYKTLWDEYCHEVQNGPHGLLEVAWEHTFYSILDSIAETIPPHEGALLTISAAWELDKDDIEMTSVCVASDLIRENLKRVVDRIAGRREMWRFAPSND
jgi:hypothetical protein